MKSYKNVELFAKNAPCGSYAAGCPTGRVMPGQGVKVYTGDFHNDHEGFHTVGAAPYHCNKCEIAG